MYGVKPKTVIDPDKLQAFKWGYLTKATPLNSFSNRVKNDVVVIHVSNKQKKNINKRRIQTKNDIIYAQT